ncbi:MAG: GNAT family N-acetyltransferase [Candidatus Competibacteraceae bacterium]|jgi:predicted GNAT family N-acyltransferase|nr:GNAT family N-acetyltransferase [Candidatus Competibacteraceae bacterium]
MNEQNYTVIVTDWQTHAPALYAVRRQVFVEEQQVPEELEQDALDPRSQHVLALDRQERPIGTGRLLTDGHIGRLAVLQAWRGCGVGKALMQRLLTLASQQRFPVIELHAQVQALDFYAGLGFQVEGEEFMEAGIPHRTMRLTLPLE